jgi:2'-5' RNA ligase
MRLFVALDIEDAIRERIARFVEGVRGFAPEARWVHVESLHVTLKFVGEQPPKSLDAVQSALAEVRNEAVTLQFRGCGFFPNPKSARVFWVGIQGGEALATLAGSVDRALETLGIPREAHAYTPHLTLARGAGGSGTPRWRNGDRENSRFAKLQEKLPSLSAEFGTMTAREFFLYQSQLSPKGSRYSKLARFELG